MTKYDFVSSENLFQLAKIKKDNRWGLFDLEGNQVAPIIYDFIHTRANEQGMIDVEYIGEPGVVML